MMMTLIHLPRTKKYCYTTLKQISYAWNSLKQMVELLVDDLRRDAFAHSSNP